MPKKLLDVVYVLKSDIEPEELRYSLRSVEKNFPHRKVWFVGSRVPGFEPDAAIYHTQTGNCKPLLIKSSLWEVIKNEEVTEDFYWFNDDFFVMKPVKKFTDIVDGDLDRRICELHRDQEPSFYCRMLIKAQQELMILKMPTMNYDVHYPMRINKTLAAKSINLCSSPQFRSIYGNINTVPYIVHPDCKVYDLETVPEDETYLSTNDDTFKNGKVGRYIRESFPDPSRFEVS